MVQNGKKNFYAKFAFICIICKIVLKNGQSALLSKNVNQIYIVVPMETKIVQIFRAEKSQYFSVGTERRNGIFIPKIPFFSDCGTGFVPILTKERGVERNPKFLECLNV